MSAAATTHDATAAVLDAVKAKGTYVGHEPGRPPAGATEHVISGAIVQKLVLGELGGLSRPVVRLVGVRIEGDVDLSYCEWRGNLALEHCRIEGDLKLEHAHVRGRICATGTSLRCLDLSNAVIEGSALFDEGHAEAGLFGLGCEVTGALDLRGATILAPPDNPNRSAVELFRAKLADLYMNDAKLCGGLYANGMRVERNVRLQGATAASRLALKMATGPDNAKGPAVSLTGAAIGAALYLYGPSEGRAAALTGQLDLARVSCTSLYVRAEDLANVEVALDGFTYRRLMVIEPDQWLELIERMQPASNQPYIFFASHCQAYGLTRLRREALVAMQDQAASERPRARDRALWKGWKLSVRYGYAPALAIAWLILAAALCTAVLALNSRFLIDDHGVRGLHGAGQVFAFGIDSGLPFASLSSADNWSADPGTLAQNAWMVLFVLLKFIGWGLAALGLASLSGIAKRE